MNDPFVHLALFVAIGAGITLLGSFHTETEDGPALRLVPKRLLWFAIGCAILAGILVGLELTVASVS